MSSEIRKTPLYDVHVEAGAKMVPFAGWEMPVLYQGISEEHNAVRESCGVFDVSHMGEIEVSGPAADELLQRLLSNDVSKVEVGGAQYSCLCQENGGVLDDLFSYRLGPDRWLTVTNASNHESDLAWFRRHGAGADAVVDDAAGRISMLAVQGPRAREIVAGLAEGELPARFRAETLTVAGSEMLVCGTGYTGEDGVELLMPPEAAVSTWEALTTAGAIPAGLGARDTLRLEVGYCLYGNELSTDRTPIEAGLGWCVREGTDFIGAEACAAAREAGPDERLVSLKVEGPGIPRQGNEVKVDGEVVGVITSGTLSPSLGVGIGLAYLESRHAEPGTAVEIDVRGKPRSAQVVEPPLYRREE